MKQKVSQIGSRGIPGHRGGVERVIEAVAPRLAALGHDITVYCANWSSYKEPTYKGVRLVYIPSLKNKYLDTFLRSLFATLTEFFGPSDIIHFHSSGSAPLVLLAKLTRKKVVVTIHGLDWQRRKWNVFGEWFLRIGEWAAVRLPHKTIVVGMELKRYLDERYGVDVTYIPNGVEERLTPPADKIKVYGIGSRDYFLFLARLVPEKQCHALLQAFQELEDNRGMKLVIAGPTWHSQEYAAQLRDMAGDNPDIIFTGEVNEDELEELYSNCYAYVLPSEVEGMSLSLLDSMAFGACVIVSDIAPNLEVIGDAGLAFRTGSVPDLKDTLQNIIHDPERAETLRRRAQQRITQEFHWDKIAGQWESFYDSLMSV